MPEEGQKSNLFTKIQHLFSKEEAEKPSLKKEDIIVKIGKIVEPDLEADENGVKFLQTTTPGASVAQTTTKSKDPEQTAFTEPEGDLDIKFAQSLVRVGAKFVYCETHKDVILQVLSMKEEKDWKYIFTWEPKLKNLFEQYAFQNGVIGFTIENSSAAASFCEYLIADTGNILLSSTQATRRQLPVFPGAHIIIADRTQLKANLQEAAEAFKAKFKDELPSIINLSKEPRSKLEFKNSPILEASGPSDIYVFLTDEPLK